jgi:hypothetical protein
MKLMSDWNNVLEISNRTAAVPGRHRRNIKAADYMVPKTVNKKFKLLTCAWHFAQKHEAGIKLYWMWITKRDVENIWIRWQ